MTDYGKNFLYSGTLRYYRTITKHFPFSFFAQVLSLSASISTYFIAVYQYRNCLNSLLMLVHPGGSLVLCCFSSPSLKVGRLSLSLYSLHSLSLTVLSSILSNLSPLRSLSLFSFSSSSSISPLSTFPILVSPHCSSGRLARVPSGYFHANNYFGVHIYCLITHI